MAGEAIQAILTAGGPLAAGAWGVVHLGRFLKDAFPKSVERLDLHLEEKLEIRHREWKQLREKLFAGKIADEAARVGLDQPTRQAPASLLLPLIEAGALEEDELLGDMWARMTVNALDADSTVEVRRAYISILQDCLRLDVRILATMYNADEELRRDGFISGHLPGMAVSSEAAKKAVFVHPPISKEKLRSLWNLARLGLISGDTISGGNWQICGDLSTALGVGLVALFTL